MEKRRLTRSNNGMIAGICAGIADYFDWDPTLVRIGYILLSLFTVFAGFLMYIVCWIVIPKENSWILNFLQSFRLPEISLMP